MTESPSRPRDGAQLTRRAMLGVLGAGAVGYAVFGPRPSKERSDGRLVLDYWEKWTQNEAAAMKVVVDRFNASQDRLFVRYFSVSPIDQKAMIAIAGGDPPDILGLGNFSIPAYAESGAILPLDEYAKKAGIERGAYAPAAWRMCLHPAGSEGVPRLYGIIVTNGSLALFYNRALFREVGLDPDQPPRTISELDAANRKLMLFKDSGAPGGVTTQDDGERDLARVGYIHTEPNWWTWHFGYSFGGTILDEAHDKATADSPENIRAYEWVQSYPRGLSRKDQKNTLRLVRFQTGLGKYGTADNPFLTGKIAMTYQGPWLANVIHEYHPDLDYGVAPFPVEDSLYDPDRPIGLLDGDVLTIPTGAKHPEASFEFIAYTQRPENLEFLASAHGKNSPLVKVSPDFEKGHVNKYVGVHAKIANSPRAFIFPRTRTWQEYVSEWNAAFGALWQMQIGVPEALERVRAADQRHLDRAAEARRKRGES